MSTHTWRRRRHDVHVDQVEGLTRSTVGFSDRERNAAADVPPFSLTLPGGRVAAVYQGSLVIAVPHGEASLP
jgi:hypothetical protein